MSGGLQSGFPNAHEHIEMQPIHPASLENKGSKNSTSVDERLIAAHPAKPNEPSRPTLPRAANGQPLRNPMLASSEGFQASKSLGTVEDRTLSHDVISKLKNEIGSCITSAKPKSPEALFYTQLQKSLLGDGGFAEEIKSKIDNGDIKSLEDLERFALKLYFGKIDENFLAGFDSKAGVVRAGGRDTIRGQWLADPTQNVEDLSDRGKVVKLLVMIASSRTWSNAQDCPPEIKDSMGKIVTSLELMHENHALTKMGIEEVTMEGTPNGRSGFELSFPTASFLRMMTPNHPFWSKLETSLLASNARSERLVQAMSGGKDPKNNARLLQNVYTNQDDYEILIAAYKLEGMTEEEKVQLITKIAKEGKKTGGDGSIFESIVKDPKLLSEFLQLVDSGTAAERMKARFSSQGEEGFGTMTQKLLESLPEGERSNFQNYIDRVRSFAKGESQVFETKELQRSEKNSFSPGVLFKKAVSAFKNLPGITTPKFLRNMPALMSFIRKTRVSEPPKKQTSQDVMLKEKVEKFSQVFTKTDSGKVFLDAEKARKLIESALKTKDPYEVFMAFVLFQEPNVSDQFSKETEAGLRRDIQMMLLNISKPEKLKELMKGVNPHDFDKFAGMIVEGLGPSYFASNFEQVAKTTKTRMLS